MCHYPFSRRFEKSSLCFIGFMYSKNCEIFFMCRGGVVSCEMCCFWFIGLSLPFWFDQRKVIHVKLRRFTRNYFIVVWPKMVVPSRNRTWESGCLPLIQHLCNLHVLGSRSNVFVLRCHSKSISSHGRGGDQRNLRMKMGLYIYALAMEPDFWALGISWQRSIKIVSKTR